MRFHKSEMFFVCPEDITHVLAPRFGRVLAQDQE